MVLHQGLDVQIIFTVLIDAISTVGKNGQQILSSILKQIKLNAKLLTSFTTSGRAESSLINHVQVPGLHADLHCQEDTPCFCNQFPCCVLHVTAISSLAAYCIPLQCFS